MNCPKGRWNNIRPWRPDIVCVCLRQREIETIFRIGCRRLTIARLIAAEMLIIILASGCICGVMMFVTNRFANELVRMLIIRN